MPRAATLDTPIVRGVYVNRWAVQSARRMRQLIDLADRTEVNAFVLDMKDEFGLNYETRNPAFAKNAGNAGRVRNLKALLDTLTSPAFRAEIDALPGYDTSQTGHVVLEALV